MVRSENGVLGRGKGGSAFFGCFRRFVWLSWGGVGR